MGILHLDQYHHEIAAVAAEVGIDWQKAADKINTWGWTSNSPALPGYNSDKLSMRAWNNADGCVLSFKRWQGSGVAEESYWYENAARKRAEKNTGRLPVKVTHTTKPAPSRSDEEKKAAVIKIWTENYRRCREYAPFDFLMSKNIPADDLKLMKDVNGEECAVVPMMRGDQIVGFEKRYKDGRKQSVWGSKKKGSYFLIGCRHYHQTDLAICSSWTTGKTLNLITKKPVIVCFSDGNVLPVVEMMLKNGVQAKDLTYYADNDTRTDTGEIRTDGNPGLSVGLELSYRKQIKVRYPDFTNIDTGGINKPSDFNDLYLVGKEKEVIRQSEETVLRCPKNAWEYKLLKLSYCASSEVSEILTALYLHSMRKNKPRTETDTYAMSFRSSVSADDLTLAADKAVQTISQKSFWAHKISPKRHKHQKVQFKDIGLVREAHGGYSIPTGFYDSIKGFNGIVVVQSPMGSGKTEEIARKALFSSAKSAYIAHRINLIEEVSERLSIPSYRDPDIKSTEGINRLACCINSITTPRMGFGHWFDDVETLVIDEGTKVLRHLAGNAIKNQDYITDNLLSAVKVSRQTIICDADANSNLVDLLSEILPDRNILVCRDEPKMDHVAVTLSSAKQGMVEIENTLKDGKKVLVAADSKSDVDTLLKLYSGSHKIIGVHGDARDNPQVQKWIKNPDKESVNYDIVVFNGSVDSGVSLTAGHFDRLIGIFRGVVGVTSVIQMMGRDRTARDWFIGCSPMNSTLQRDKKEVIINALVKESSVISSSLESDYQLKKTPEPKAFDIIKLSMVEDDKQSREDYFLTLESVLSQKGYKTLILPESDEAKSTGKLVSEIKKEIRRKKIDTVIQSETPDKEKYLFLRGSKNLTESEIAQVTRYEVTETLGLNEISEEDIIFWIDEGKIKAKNYEILTGNPDVFLKYDQFEFTKTAALTLRNNYYEQARILNRLFCLLGIDKKTGEGVFNHHQCQEFIDYLYKFDKIHFFNITKLGPFLNKDSQPKCATSFVKSVLEKMGLSTEKKLKGDARLSHHQITEQSWLLMSKYCQGRRKSGKSVDTFTMPKSNYNHLTKEDRIQAITDDWFDTLIAQKQLSGEFLE